MCKKHGYIIVHSMAQNGAPVHEAERAYRNATLSTVKRCSYEFNDASHISPKTRRVHCKELASLERAETNRLNCLPYPGVGTDRVMLFQG